MIDYDDEDDYEEDDDYEDKDDDEDEYEELDDYFYSYDDYEQDKNILSNLKRKNPTQYKRFMTAKKIMKSREITMEDILGCEITDEKRANLIEKFECLKNIEPCTEEYLESRDKLRSIYYKYLSEFTFGYQPPMPSTPILSSLNNMLNMSLKKMTDHELEISIFKEKIRKLECSNHNRKVFDDKLDEFEENIKGEEKSKIKKWLNNALLLPFDKLTKPNISNFVIIKDNKDNKENKEKKEENHVATIIQKSQDFLDKRLYGMKNVKERLLLFLNKKLRESNSRGCNIALVGKPGVGKCLHPDTEVRMYDLSIKKAKDIVEGDILLGDDQQPRKVLSVTTGREEMFSVTQTYGDTYIVNRSHILSLRERTTKQIVDISIEDLLKDPDYQKRYTPYSTSYFGSLKTEGIRELGRLCVSQSEDLPPNYMMWTYEDKYEFFNGLIGSSEAFYRDNNCIRLCVKTKTKNIKDIINLIRSMGWRCVYDNDTHFLYLYYPDQRQSEDITLTSLGEGEYCGFTIDGNRRFVLEDWTVTHNTAISKALSECLELPFSQVSFGGVANSEFLMGHDYTYVGSRPGEISRCLMRMGTKNGILFFDEFDKATDKKDIMSCLLHITDFSQNSEFRDSYFPELTQDLSKIWFIYSMNELPTDPAMLDRLEIIHVDEYTTEERKTIAEKYLFPKYIKEVKIEKDILVKESGISTIVDVSSSQQYKKGVRDLERCINLVIEKIYFYICNKEMNCIYPWFKIVKESVQDQKVVVTSSLVENILKEFGKKDSTSHLNMYL